ncbi:hypothetical protein F2Q69_00048049 [Brassica cretica]|uniref:Uncharacterized protein n=1 Tax=Brassica cretica TaxID=69181 RepID=A0A8S9PU09_BRACR|nr:hypothetical protein F2Q69_00048049 [Brassica cretica]
MSSQLTTETVCSVNSPLPLSPPDLLNLNASSLDLLDYPPPLTLRFLGLAFLLWFVSNTNEETSLHCDNLCLFQRKGHNRSLTVAPAHPHQLDYAALPPFLSLIPTDLLIWISVPLMDNSQEYCLTSPSSRFSILESYFQLHASMVSIPRFRPTTPSDYANHSVRFSAKFNNGFREENKFNCLTILLTNHVALWVN